MNLLVEEESISIEKWLFAVQQIKKKLGES